MKHFLALQVRSGIPIMFYGVAEGPHEPDDPSTGIGEKTIYVEISKKKYDEIHQVMIEMLS